MCDLKGSDKAPYKDKSEKGDENDSEDLAESRWKPDKLDEAFFRLEVIDRSFDLLAMFIVQKRGWHNDYRENQQQIQQSQSWRKMIHVIAG